MRPVEAGAEGLALAQTDYLGWSVLLRDGSRIYEHNPFIRGMSQLHPAAPRLPTRPADRVTMDWKHLPLPQIIQLEIYWNRHLRLEDGTPADQPAILLRRDEGMGEMVFIQFKKGGLVAGGESGRGQERTGIYAYVGGYWNPTTKICQLWETCPQGVKEREPVVHPCWPRPHGYALAPFLVGLKDEDVPLVPNNELWLG